MYLATLARRGRFDSTDSMTQHRIESATDQPTVPPILLSWLAVFRPCFTAPVWKHVLVLVAGAILAPGKRTVTQALRVMGLDDQSGAGGRRSRRRVSSVTRCVRRMATLSKPVVAAGYLWPCSCRFRSRNGDGLC